jgi:MtN3 and saliva related transmembrane protein
LAACLPLLNYDEYREADGEVMTTDNWVTVAGSLGGFCTTVAFVPQVLKIWKQGGRDLSYGMLSLYLLGVILWLAYGILLRAQAVIITNFATSILIAIATVLKAWTAKRDSGKEVIVAAAGVDKAV